MISDIRSAVKHLNCAKTETKLSLAQLHKISMIVFFFNQPFTFSFLLINFVRLTIKSRNFKSKFKSNHKFRCKRKMVFLETFRTQDILNNKRSFDVSSDTCIAGSDSSKAVLED